MTDPDKKIIRVTTWIAAALSAIIAGGLPIIYWSTSYEALDTSLMTEVEITAGLVTQVVNDNPSMWRYEGHRLADLLGRRSPVAMRGATSRILDLHGEVVAESDGASAPPPRVTVTRGYPIFDSGRKAGRVEITRTLFPLALRTAGMALLGVLAGILFFAFLRRYPLNTLERALGALAAEREAVLRSLREKEVLLQEIHHRVKNNLQVISGLIDLEIRFISVESDRDVLRESQRRIRTMSLVHERLYRSTDLEAVDMSLYLKELGEQLAQSFSLHHSGVGLDISAGEARMTPDTAIPLGLIVNELVSNAFKHGFPGSRSGTVAIGFRALPDSLFELTVADDGVGLPPGFDPGRCRSLGVKLVTLLAHQLGAEFGFAAGDVGRGTSFRMVFREYHEAPAIVTQAPVDRPIR